MSETKQLASPPKQDTQSAPPVVAIIALVISIAAAGFFFYQTNQLMLANASLEKHLSLLTEQTQSQQQNNADQKAQLSNTQQALTAMEGHLAFMQQTLNQIPGARLDDWKLAEVEYLLRLGNQRVTLQKEAQGALALFDAANQILASLDDPALIVVREKIAEEMLKLGNTTEIDQQGIYSQIQALKNLIHNSIQPPETYTTAQLSVVDSAASDAQLSLMDQVLALVTVRKREDAFDAPLAAEQYQLLEHSLNLMLEQAQWALLKGDQSLYENSLKNASSWIEKKLRHQQAIQFLTDIKKLSALTVSTAMPDVSGSLRILRQILQDRTYQPSPINVEEAEQEQTPLNSAQEAEAKNAEASKPVMQEQA